MESRGGGGPDGGLMEFRDPSKSGIQTQKPSKSGVLTPKSFLMEFVEFGMVAAYNHQELHIIGTTISLAASFPYKRPHRRKRGNPSTYTMHFCMV